MTDNRSNRLTDNEFFAASDQLALIYQWARARYAAPWAVFFAVLLRVAASVGPHVQLPGVIGGRASLNLLCAFVSASGGGKGISDKVARLAWPSTTLELPTGSGEGITETLKDKGEDTVSAVIFNIPEIDTLAGIASRQGSILLAQLKSMAMGEQLGQTNASKATSRVVQAHTYRCCLSIGAQPGHCAVILDDASGGTPQRLLWAPTVDPDMPADRQPDPDPLNAALPVWAPGMDGVVEIAYGPSEIAETIVAAHLARQRGQGDALDGHWMLTRCKVAAVLAIMHHRSVVSELDWQLSDTVMAVSDATRDWIVTEAKQAARSKVRDRAMARAAGEEFIDQRRLDVVKRRVLRVLADGRIARGELRARMGKKEYRELLEAAVAELAAEGAIVRSDASQGGIQFELTPEFSPEPQFRPDNRSSEVLNREFSPEPAGSRTDLDSRRSSESDEPKVSAAKWLDAHIAGLQSAGLQSVESFAVLDAAEAAHYRRQSIVAEASKHRDVKVVGRGSYGTTWWIDPTEPPPGYQSAAEWIEGYVQTIPDNIEIDKADFKSQGTEAGFSWENLRKSIKDRSDVEVIANGPRSTWTMRRTAEESAS